MEFEQVVCVKAYIFSSTETAWGGREDYVYAYENTPLGKSYFPNKKAAEEYAKNYNSVINEGEQKDIEKAAELYDLYSLDLEGATLKRIIYKLASEEILSENQIKNLWENYGNADQELCVVKNYLSTYNLKEVLIPINEFVYQEPPAIAPYVSVWDVIGK